MKIDESVEHNHGRAVVLVLTPAEPLTRVVQAAARAARQRDESLTIVMVPTGAHVRAPCMAALDTALQLARRQEPRLTVRVHTLAAHDVDAHLLADDVVVASPRTWSGLPDHVRATRRAGPLLELVDPQE